MNTVMTNNVRCQCGKLSGTVEIVKQTLVLNYGLKFELAYSVTGKFVTDTKANLLICAECKGHAYTDADWELINSGASYDSSR